jgi:serine/threonine-protein kinase
MLGDFGEVYVLDWGLARLGAELPEGENDDGETSGYRPTAAFTLRTLPGALLGTPGYMAPEQLGAAEEVGPAADVYALGAILFELLTGTPLHDPESATDAVRSTIQAPAPRPSARNPERSVPPELDALCYHAIRRDPGRRLASARLLHDALERYLAGEQDTELRRELAQDHIHAAEEHRRAPTDPIVGRSASSDGPSPSTLATTGRPTPSSPSSRSSRARPRRTSRRRPPAPVTATGGSSPASPASPT